MVLSFSAVMFAKERFASTCTAFTELGPKQLQVRDQSLREQGALEAICATQSTTEEQR
jgi:hypothetical protein